MAGLLRAARCGARRRRPTRSSGRTGNGPASSIPTPTPATPRPRPSSRRSPSPTRPCRTRSGASSTTRTAEARTAAATRSAGGGLGDIFDMFFGGRQPLRRCAAAPDAVRPVGPTSKRSSTSTFDDAVFGVEAPVTVRTAVPCEDCEGTGRRGRQRPADLPRLRRRRPGAPGPPVDPRPDGHRRPVPPLQRVRHRDRASPCPTCQGEGRSRRRAHLHRRRAGRRRHRRHPAAQRPGRGRARGGGTAGDLYVHVRVRPHEHFDRHGDDLVHELHVPVTQAALGAHVAVRDPRRRRASRRSSPAPRPARSCSCRVRRACPTSQGRGRGDLLVQVVVDTPTDLTVEEDECSAAWPSSAGDEVAPAEHGLHVEAALRVQVGAVTADEGSPAADPPRGNRTPRVRRRPRRTRS